MVRWSWLTLVLLFGSPLAWATPVYQAPAGSDPTARLQVTLVGSDQALSRFTIGLIHLTGMTADASGPDFQVQALQADRVTVLQEFGRPLQREFSLDFDPQTLGVFILRDATLRDFSRGRNLYRPLFSLPGAPGSNLSDLTLAKDGALQFIEFALGTAGRVHGTGPGALFDDRIGVELFDRQAPLGDEPVIPEPATLALVGGGLLAAAALRRRR